MEKGEKNSKQKIYLIIYYVNKNNIVLHNNPSYFLYHTLCTGPISLSLTSLAVTLCLGIRAPEFIPLSQAPSDDHLGYRQ